MLTSLTIRFIQKSQHTPYFFSILLRQHQHKITLLHIIQETSIMLSVDLSSPVSLFSSKPAFLRCSAQRLCVEACIFGVQHVGALCVST